MSGGGATHQHWAAAAADSHAEELAVSLHILQIWGGKRMEQEEWMVTRSDLRTRGLRWH